MREASKRTLIIVHSWHHRSTEKVARAMAAELCAEVKSPQDARPEELAACDLIGFGAGIDSGRHYAPLLAFAEALPDTQQKKAFIFSTSALVSDRKIAKDHAALRRILTAKGYVVLDEFACKGYNTNSFLKYLGGMNNGRPNAEDLQAAGAFARSLAKY